MIQAHESQLVERIKENDLVLDVGGWHAPLNRADAVIDIMPFESRNRPGALLTSIWPDERFTKNSYFQSDICSGRWPFEDKIFDFVFCVHTVEDLRDPVHVCAEMNRVAKAGYLEVPSRFTESTKGVERPFYCGYYHHRWLCEVEGTRIIFQFKPAMLHAYRRFHFRKPLFKKVNPKYESVGFFWEKQFEYEERIVIDRDEVQQSLIAFKKRFQEYRDLFVSKGNDG